MVIAVNSVYADEEEKQVECQSCGNQVNKGQIHDTAEVCIGCYYRTQDQQDTMNDHSNIQHQSNVVQNKKNLYEEYKAEAAQQ